MKRFNGVLGLMGLVMLTFASLAAAGQGTQQGGYPRQGVSGNAAGQVAGTGGTLPFTGLNLVLLVVGGALLVGLGVLIVMRGRHDGSRL